jgi:hypothetical protein
VFRRRAHGRVHRERYESLAASAGSMRRATPNLVTSWPEGHGCKQSGNGSGPNTMPSDNLSQNVSQYSCNSPRVAAAECPANPAALLRRSRLACLPQRHVLLARGSWARTGPLAGRQSGKEMPFLAMRRAICAACQQDRCSGVTGRGHGRQESELITLLGSAATVVSLTHPRCCAADRPADMQCARAPGNRAVL